jgi:hypothetical protein
MSKRPRKYKAYLTNRLIAVPKSTRNEWKRLKFTPKLNTDNNVNSLANQTVLKDQNDTSQIHNEHLLNENNDSNYINLNRFDMAVDSRDKTELEILEELADLTNEFESHPPVYEISFAMIALFFSGKMTQNTLIKTAKIINIFNKNQMPSNFDNLLDLIIKQNNDDLNFDSLIKNYNKKYFCNICAIYEKLENKSQRNCSKCGTK